ncbi:CubicO group peptidase, beta-lactamase class C family [Lachnospiraceae bacterium NK3A20]|nr:CubicO group peptidase, beta-lactamase class C family [Lachnospiraceae bacterium NK3A20]
MKKEVPLPRCTPEEAGFSSLDVTACIQALQHPETDMNSFIAARHGKVFAECWWTPYSPELVHVNHSFGKSYTATAIGIAEHEGYLKRSDKIVDIFEDEIRGYGITPSPRMKKITIEHVLTMTNGMAKMPSMEGNFVKNYLAAEVVYEPGTRFLYNSTGSCMLGAIIKKRTGMNLKEYLTPRLFEKIGIAPENFTWLSFRGMGINAEPGTFAKTEDNLRLAMLYCSGGCWNGEQILAQDFVSNALSVKVDTFFAPEHKDGLQGYGYQLWKCSLPGVYRFDGGQGQYGLIWPEKDLVVAVHEGAYSPDGPQMTLDVLYDYLLGKIADEPLPEAPENLLKLREVEREVHVPAEAPNSIPFPVELAGTYAIQDGHFDPWFAASPPGVGDLFRIFREPELDIPISFITLSASETGPEIRFGDDVLKASWDGNWKREKANSCPYPNLGNYAACARMTDAATLEFNIRWLNGWFQTVLIFSFDGQGGLKLTTKKLRLNRSDNFLIYENTATKI